MKGLFDPQRGWNPQDETHCPRVNQVPLREATSMLSGANTQMYSDTECRISLKTEMLKKL